MATYLNSCLAAEKLAQELLPNLGGLLQITFSLATLGLIAACVFTYNCNKISIHPNFVLIMANIVCLYVYHSIGSIALHGRYQILLQPCDILTPNWLNILLMSTYYVYVQAFVLSHFALTTERIRATLSPKTYETKGITYGVVCLVFVRKNLITMRLVFPLDLAFAFFFSTYLAGATVLRSFKSSITSAQFIGNYDFIYSLLSLHSVVSILIYLRFTKLSKVKAIVIEPHDTLPSTLVI
uniref:Vomeronasal type-1 receptor n=1 Tax=Ditylenchus dipsaci TaxID=166011 RepID=A0A915D9K7_9BILA